ncbi:16S rRNA (guanine(527)-N(7))-methyltransferase RsmG [Tabrizicola sp.]|uniref:16S rRNA (guanine(527)-N(7))-methyltransferase RsmG n=1 Tax=Tabrizicola sp. TaxID=2005166 RepID=UPI002606DFFE|nr:16S rRNA (guanine(527)-N(7))-methyltransferase RsmG [Tabrizicola sp.]MDM7931699.1 16S rRNA (guanine(527)-N(7))-methyltransferase RsmG [Tabrizicola sp.]
MNASGELRIAGLDVSRETFEALEAFAALVRRWNPAVNLVSATSLSHLFDRHIVDSAQLYKLAPTATQNWVDLGSGGGFPGLVIAILAKGQNSDLRITLVESDARKATFLRQAAQSLGLQVCVLNDRIESIPQLGADVLSARALAPLVGLLPFAERHLRSDGSAIFPKGARFAEELTEARKSWDFEVDTHSSLSEPGSAVLVIRKIRRAKND